MTNTSSNEILQHSRLHQKTTWFGKMQRLSEKLFFSRHYEKAVTLCACLLLMLPQAHVGFGTMVLFASFMLLFCHDFMAFFSPFLSICLLSTRFYADYRQLLVFWPLFAVGALCLLAHFILYRAPLKKGEMTLPLCAVSLATMLGGLGTIRAEQYFTPLSLYYCLCLGPIMLLLYTMVLSQFRKVHAYDLLGKYLSTLYYAGILAAFVVVWTYVLRFDEFLAGGTAIWIDYRNYLVTTMLVGLPCACIWRLGRKRFLGMGLMYGAMLLSASRSGLIFGSVELVLSLLWCFIRLDKPARKIVAKAAVALMPVCIVLIIVVSKALFASRLIDGMLISDGDSRYTFFLQGMRDFLSAPIFGMGLGNLKNSAIFIGVRGSIVWYHNIIAQVLGSLGLVGAAAYLWLYYKRLHLLVERRSTKMVAAFLATLGMLMINLTNPGEFCPFPNAFIMTAFFAVIELLPKRHTIK